MKAILEFNLPEDNREHLLAIHGADFNFVCWDLDEILRSFHKHGHDFNTPDEVIKFVRDTLRQSMDDRHITLDMSC